MRRTCSSFRPGLAFLPKWPLCALFARHWVLLWSGPAGDCFLVGPCFTGAVVRLYARMPIGSPWLLDKFKEGFASMTALQKTDMAKIADAMLAFCKSPSEENFLRFTARCKLYASSPLRTLITSQSTCHWNLDSLAPWNGTQTRTRRLSPRSCQGLMRVHEAALAKAGGSFRWRSAILNIGRIRKGAGFEIGRRTESPL